MDSAEYKRVRDLFHEIEELPPERQRVAIAAASLSPDGLALLSTLLEEDAESILLGTEYRSRAMQELAGDQVPERIAEFRVQGVLGRGGMGVVYRAVQDRPRREVAIKVLNSVSASPEALRRFEYEAEILGRLDHPCIAKVFQARVDDSGAPFIVMELVEGTDLASWCDEQGLGDRDRIELVKRVCEGVEHAHQRGVVHRDLKPANILVSADGRPRILDFGIARPVRDEDASTPGRTESGVIVGSLSWMSPEQARGEIDRIDVRTDVYSLGVILYRLLGGRMPHEVRSLAVWEAARRISEEEPTRLGKVRAELRGDLEAIVSMALEKEPDRRYAGAGALARDLGRYLAHEPIEARAWSTAYQLKKLARRHRVLLGAGTLVLVSLLAGLATSLVQWRRASRAVRDRDLAIGSLEGANKELERQSEELNELNETLSQEVASVKRLSALRDYDDLIARVDALWPPHPEELEAFAAWMDDARTLVADLPLHYAKRDELRGGARKPTEAELEAERRAHPDRPRLEALRAELASRRAALAQRRDGEPAPALEPNWSELPMDSRALEALARRLVEPGRELYGREAEGLALAERALELAEAAADDGLLAAVSRTLSLALFSLGRDEEALAEIAMSAEIAPVGQRSDYEEQQRELERWVEAATGEDGLSEAAEAIVALETESRRLEDRMGEGAWKFPDTAAGRQARWWHTNLTKLITSLEDLQSGSTGLLSSSPDASSPEHGWSVPRRVALAKQLRDGQAEGTEWADRWRAAIASIREHPDYGGLELSPQTGLVPIGQDPESGLWEFWHVATGDEPTRVPDGALLPTERMGLVLVLVPPGKFWMGAQAKAPGGRNYDANAYSDEEPVHMVELSAYFISKYEMTQGQWSRFTGRNPSHYQPPDRRAPSLRHPVEQISWLDAMRELSRMGLRLPSEAQWEYACRAGTDTPWHFGGERESIRGRVNIADKNGSAEDWPATLEWPEHEDGSLYHSEVGAYPANAWGLYEVHGNLWEWCLDGSHDYVRDAQVDPVFPWEGAELHCYRGGAFNWGAFQARSSLRTHDLPHRAADSIGVRPARLVSR